jgi:serine/threonine protein kinase
MIGKVLGHYQIVREIGFGGMSAVYLAEDTHSSQPVALKLLPSEYINDLGMRASFDREARLIAALNHEAIVRIDEFGVHDGQPFIAMPYMPNGSLADRLIRAPISPEETGQILKRLSSAIDYAHDRGIIHGDLKPSNILFDERDQPYLADFGIAWQTTSARQPGAFASGTPAYLSPEQAFSDQIVDNRSDIYALGIILFEMLTGRLPFDGQTPLAIILQHRYDPPPSLRTIDWSLPATLDPVIQRALAKLPDERYTAARELSQAFHRALESPAGAESPDEQLIHGPVGEQDRPPQAELSDSVSAPRIGMVPSRSPHRAVHGQYASIRSGLAGGVNPSTNRAVRWRGIHTFTLAAATLLGVLLAGSLVAFLRALPSKSTPGVVMDYDSGSFTITNQYSLPVNLSKAVFQRIGDDGTVTANFIGSNWQVFAGNAPQELLPGACFQVLRSTSAVAHLMPGETLPKPGRCQSVQAWLFAFDSNWLFWVSENDSRSFRIILDEKLDKTCQIAARHCDFTLPAP